MNHLFVLYTGLYIMVTIDLSKTSRTKLRQMLAQHAGFHDKPHQLGFTRARGVGGFVFTDKVGEEIIEYKANLELYPEGIGMYCRSRSNNFLVILPFANIEKISVYKEEDVIRANSFSWFRTAMKFGIPYERVRSLVLENEWVRMYPLSVTFYTRDKLEFTIIMHKIRSSAVRLFFNRVTDQLKVDVEIKNFYVTNDI